MKQIINGKIYNTDTAWHVARAHNGLESNDFNCVDETLYRTKKGQFFLDRKRGAATQYAVPVGNMSGGSRKLILLTKDEAKEWLERHGTSAEYETVFQPEEG